MCFTWHINSDYFPAQRNTPIRTNQKTTPTVTKQLRVSTVSFVMSVRLSVRANMSPPLARYSLNLYCAFMINRRYYPSLVTKRTENFMWRANRAVIAFCNWDRQCFLCGACWGWRNSSAQNISTIDCTCRDRDVWCVLNVKCAYLRNQHEKHCKPVAKIRKNSTVCVKRGVFCGNWSRT